MTLSEGEINAFLSRHLTQVGSSDLSDFRVRLPGPGTVELAARVRFAELVSETPLTGLAAHAPDAWTQRRVRLWVRATPRVETGHDRRHYLAFDVTRFRIGEVPLPAVTAKLLLDPGALQLLRWPLPETIGDVRIEKGQAVLLSASR